MELLVTATARGFRGPRIINPLTPQPQWTYYEILGDIWSGLGNKGERRLSCVTVSAFRRATKCPLAGWRGRKPGGIPPPPDNYNLCEVVIFIGQPGHAS